MAKILSLTIVMLMGALVALGWATERLPHPRVVAGTDQVVTFSDGTQLWQAEELGVGGLTLTEGVKVKLTFEERDGRHVVTGVDAD